MTTCPWCETPLKEHCTLFMTFVECEGCSFTEIVAAKE